MLRAPKLKPGQLPSAATANPKISPTWSLISPASRAALSRELRSWSMAATPRSVRLGEHTHETWTNHTDLADLRRSQGPGVLRRFPRIQGRLGTSVRARLAALHAGLKGRLHLASVRTFWRRLARHARAD